jgi:xylan 1,4-beta-xylosidase
MADFLCNCAGSGIRLPHFWERCVGSGHSSLALRADYQAQLKRCSRELGFQKVRFHGWFLEEMSLVLGEGKKLEYSFLNADRIVDFLDSIQMQPLVELSFMPEPLASGSQTVFRYRGNITPPKNYRQWKTVVKKLLAHWRDFYGAKKMRDWFFEVWNEPNGPTFWSGKQSDYFKLYQYTAEAVKEVDADFSVGGPATAQNKWIPQFLDHCRRHQLPVDFVSTHHYPNDPPLDKMAATTSGQLAHCRRSRLREQARDARREAGALPLFYTEWNTSSDDRDPLHDQSYAAAFIIKTILEANGLVDLYSFWVFTDIFAETGFASRPFHGGFGLMTLHGVPKPSYRAFELLHGLGEELLISDGLHPTLDVWFVRGSKKITVLLTNSALPEHEIKTERAQIKLENAGRPSSVTIERIDEDNANPRRAWQEMGRPEYLKPGQIEELETASKMMRQKLPFTFSNGVIAFDLNVPPHGVAAITIELANGKK